MTGHLGSPDLSMDARSVHIWRQVGLKGEVRSTNVVACNLPFVAWGNLKPMSRVLSPPLSRLIGS
jgi:hypothetical protein